jgi:hypothetical protein
MYVSSSDQCFQAEMNGIGLLLLSKRALVLDKETREPLAA